MKRTQLPNEDIDSNNHHNQDAPNYNGGDSINRNHPSPDNTNEGEVVREEDTDLLDPNYVHPDAARWFDAMPCLRDFPLFGKASSTFGPYLVAALGMGYFLSKGAAGGIINYSRQPIMMNDYQVSTEEYQRYASMYMMGQSIKAFGAVITDLFPCFGYTKRWYMAFSAFSGSVATLTYGLLPAARSSARPAAACIFLTSFCKANIEILSEGLYSRLMRRVPEVGPALVSWVSACTFAGTLLCSCMMGPLSDANLTYVGVIISAVLQFFTVFIFAFNLYGEKPNREERHRDAMVEYRARVAAQEKSEERLQREEVGEEGEEEEKEAHVEQHREADLRMPVRGGSMTALLLPPGTIEPLQEAHIISCPHCPFEINVEVVTHNPRIVGYAALMTCAVIVMSVVTVVGDVWTQLYTSILFAIFLIVGAFYALPRVVAKVALFMILNSLLYMRATGALKNFYLAKKECFPTGPNFSYTFYNTFASLITNVAGMAGSVLFHTFFSKHKFVYVFIVTNLLQMSASAFDFIIVKRWNLDIGIPDHAMYIFGDAIIYEVCTVLEAMPYQMLMSRLCPRGTESMSFAILAGISSAGSAISTVVGAILLKKVWPVRTKTPCNFDNLPNLLMLGHFFLPLFVIPTAMLLLPDARICDVLDKDGRPIETPAEKKEKERKREEKEERRKKKRKLRQTNSVSVVTQEELKGEEPTKENKTLMGLVEP